MKTILSLLAALLALSSTPVRANDSSSILYFQCNVAVMDGRGPDSAMCVGYLIGLTEGLLTSTPPAICFKGYVSSTQLAMIYTTWMRQHADTMGQPRAFTASLALRDAFKCGATKREAPLLQPDVR